MSRDDCKHGRMSHDSAVVVHNATSNCTDQVNARVEETMRVKAEVHGQSENVRHVEWAHASDGYQNDDRRRTETWRASVECAPATANRGPKSNYNTRGRRLQCWYHEFTDSNADAFHNAIKMRTQSDPIQWQSEDSC